MDLQRLMQTSMIIQPDEFKINIKDEQCPLPF